MTEKEFYEEIKRCILEYLPEEYQGSKVEIHDVIKDNDTRLTGITVIKNGENAAPIIYLNGAYGDFRNGRMIDSICRQVSESIVSHNDLNKSICNIDLSYDAIKSNLRVKVVNSKTNHQILKESVSQSVGCGYSLIPYIDLKTNDMAGAMIRITKKLAEMLGYSEGQIMEDAIRETEQGDEVRLCRIEDILFSSGDEPENLLNADHSNESFDAPLVLTNAAGVLGAAYLFLPNMQKRISETIGNDYYVLPSSIHEVLILPDNDGLEAHQLVNMVREVNRSMVDPEEQLGSKVLYYSRNLGHICVAADLDRMRNKASER